MKSTQDLDLAHAFARAYREIDEEAMLGLLAPAARVRILMPRGLVEPQGPGPWIGVVRKFAEMWRTEDVDELEVELLTPNLLQTGRLVLISHRFHLRSVSSDARAKMVLKHLLAIADGKIALVDELCTGVMPEPG
jgi:hypothetical protein